MIAYSTHAEDAELEREREAAELETQYWLAVESDGSIEIQEGIRDGFEELDDALSQLAQDQEELEAAVANGRHNSGRLVVVRGWVARKVVARGEEVEE